MAIVTVNPGHGSNHKLVRISDVNVALAYNPASASSARVRFATASGTPDTVTKPVDSVFARFPVRNGALVSSTWFNLGPDRYVANADGSLYRNPSGTGTGTAQGGSVAPATGVVTIEDWHVGIPSAISSVRGAAAAPLAGESTPYLSYQVVFRIAAAPIRVGSFSVLGTMMDGTAFNYTADNDGYIDEARVKGVIDYETGIVSLVGVHPTGPWVPHFAAPAARTDISGLGVPGVTEEYLSEFQVETLRYNAVAYTYLPLEANLLGIDPVRLPSDGRVPIFRAGGLAVVGNTDVTTPQVVTNGTVINCGRVRLSRVRLLGNDNLVIETGYTEDLEAGTVTITNTTGMSQPVRVEHRIEDMGLIRDVQIDGTVTFTRALSHAYPAGSHLSSCLRTGDLKARTSLVFDQESWDGVTFSDDLDGSPAGGTYNTIGYPITVTNKGAVTERWALRFTTTMQVQVIGEHVGNLGSFSINSTIAPVNPATGVPYFSIDITGWGSGWSIGNVLRLNTVGAMFPVWMLRTVQQGPAGSGDYSFQTIVRGDVDNPAP